MIETQQKKERLILVGVNTGNEQAARDSLEELGLLVRTAGAEPLDQVVQNLEHPNPATYVGSGKLDEIRILINSCDADGIVCDDELTPAQLKNLEQELDTTVLDRTMVILDIFAARAKSSEGKIQVELAQLRYRAIRLVGMRNSLSRLGGGIGTRGPGEKKLEVDRRLIHQRIGQLKQELEQVKKHREVTRQQRNRSHVPVAAIVGYTNAGKSTLLNRMTGADVLAEDKLFATLDPTTRLLQLERDESILLTDTVGFVSKLPHHLIDAFRSTLEEAKYADLILHVVDASNPMRDMQMHVVYDTLRELGVEGKPVFTLMNKQDAVTETDIIFRDFQADRTIGISAKTGAGLEELKQALSEFLRENKAWICKLVPYDKAGRIQDIRKLGQVSKEEYREDGILVEGYLPREFAGRVADLPDAEE